MDIRIQLRGVRRLSGRGAFAVLKSAAVRRGVQTIGGRRAAAITKQNVVAVPMHPGQRPGCCEDLQDNGNGLDI
jgi:hypothetical protein